MSVTWFSFTDSNNKCHNFRIGNISPFGWHLIIPLSVGQILILINKNQELQIQWNDSIISELSNIVGFKEYIEKTIKLLVFS
jgi:hypothetical protein